MIDAKEQLSLQSTELALHAANLAARLPDSHELCYTLGVLMARVRADSQTIDEFALLPTVLRSLADRIEGRK